MTAKIYEFRSESGNDFVIRPIEWHDAKSVAALHMEFLRSHMKGHSGRSILTCCYRCIALGEGGTGFVATDGNGSIMGFVCGVWNQEKINRTLIKKFFWHLVLWGGFMVLANPALFGYYLRRITAKTLTTIRGREIEHVDGGGPEHDDTYELRPLVVNRDYQGRGVATRLTERLLRDAKYRGHKTVFLVTEVDNDRSNSFYRKHGFALGATDDAVNKYHIHIEQMEPHPHHAENDESILRPCVGMACTLAMIDEVASLLCCLA